ncbi:MAG: hypothetical protein ACRDNF_17810 [Streptosporangiaceae bacterium]
MTTYTAPTTSRPRSQHPNPDGAWLPGPGAVPATTAHKGHPATAGGRTPPRGGSLPPAPTVRQTRPADLLRDLAALLRGHGLDHLYGQATATEGVLSVAYGVTIWTNGLTLRCHTPTGITYLPASTHTAARYLADLTRHAGGPDPTSPGHPPPAVPHGSHDAPAPANH